MGSPAAGTTFHVPTFGSIVVAPGMFAPGVPPRQPGDAPTSTGPSGVRPKLAEPESRIESFVWNGPASLSPQQNEIALQSRS